MEENKLTIAIIAGNEEEVIVDCLKSAGFADKIVLISNSTDRTIDLAKKTLPKIKIIKNPQLFEKFDFSQARNLVLNHLQTQWLMYLDADERITPRLKEEVLKVINQPSPKFTNYDIPRANYFLGKRVHYGGSYPDYVKRLFLVNSFHGYINPLHEQPQVEGASSIIKNDLLHFTHRHLASMLEKTNKWTSLEAKMLFDGHHPPVVWWRFFRMMITKFFQRYIQQQMWRDGIVGLISSLFETFDTFIIYAKLWELQQHEA